MISLTTYLPQDRLRALVHGETLPDRCVGSALFADISGFTPLTERLTHELGPRRGAEELSQRINTVYDALIVAVERYGGSVINFAGDAILCWFDERGLRAPSRAVTCALALQAAMQTFPDLALKVAVASGPTRRFVVGDPNIQYLDALAGETVARTSMGEHLAHQGEVVLDEATVNALGAGLTVREWRATEATPERFAVLEQLSMTSEPLSVDELTPDDRSLITDISLLRPYLLPAVYERETSGQGAFLTEFRPCAVVFVRFTGIDYEAGDALTQLDIFVQNAQHSADQWGGAVLGLTIGDKGSYIYLNFGALNAHEDDVRRAVRAALALQAQTALPVQMGLTHGVMRVGVYGGATRQTFGALGDEVNLAARLMIAARAGEILLSSPLPKTVLNHFTFEPRPPLPLKGKAEPLPMFAVTGERKSRALRLQEPNYAVPMVGRQAELSQINDKLDLALRGRGQIIGLVAEAGLGKSRLAAEVIRSARRKGFVGYGGACQSDGLHTPYLAWKSIWQAFFEIDPEMSERKLIRWLEGEIEDRAPNRVEALPLLNAVLDLNIPDNAFTQNLEPKTRQSVLHALLEDCLKAQAKAEPILIVIEDLHWLDALSHDLLEQLVKALANDAVCFMLAYRPPQLERLQTPRLEALPQFTRIELRELSQAEAESAIRAKLAQLYPARSGALPDGLVDLLMARAQGNPFYLEELLNYLHDRGLDPTDGQRLELPDSLHTLILSRIDRLSEQEKNTLHVASIIGRLFRAKWLTGYYPELGAPQQVKTALDVLDTLDLTPLDTPEPELAYLFKHIVTHEVTYESLPFATRATLHEQLARYLESVGAPLDAIAFHYGRSTNQVKQRQYLRQAGEVAQKNFANEAALEYYRQLLPLLTDANEQMQIYLKRGEVLTLTGKYDEAERDYHAVLDSAKGDPAGQTSAQVALGKLKRLRGDYEAALTWLAPVKEFRATLGDTAGLAQVVVEIGLVHWRKGAYAPALETLNEGLALARAAGDSTSIGLALNGLGVVADLQGHYATARELYNEFLALKRETGDKAGTASALNNLGILAYNQGQLSEARALLEESL